MQNSSASETDLANWRKYRGRIGEDARATPVYKIMLNGPAPENLSIYPGNVRTGDPVRGRRLMQGKWKIGRKTFELPAGLPPWDQPGPSRHFADRLHRFHWLADLSSVGPDGERLAREFLSAWAKDFGRWNGFVWRIPVTADRLWNWFQGGPGLLENIAPDSEVLNAIVRQARHLQNGTNDCHEPRAVLKSLFTQLAAAFALDEGERRIAAVEDQLEVGLTEQILADGGHISRNPEALLEILLDMQSVDDLYLRTGRPSLECVSRFVPRIAGMLKFLRTGDGGLPPMNGGSEGNRVDLKNALFPYSGSRAFAFATKTGIQKLEAGQTRLLLDSGHAPYSDFGHETHAGALSIELEDDGQRMVTSCGSHPNVDPVWQGATRRTDGHSTLILTGMNAAQFGPIRSLGLDAPTGPAGITAKRMEENNQIMIDAQHGGWKDSVGLIYRRRLFMGGEGNKLVGEDSLFRPISAGQSEINEAIAFDVRFHLHPTVRLKPDGDHLRIILRNGSEWIFETSHKRKSIERSVYLARGTVEKCWQMVLSGYADPNGDATMESNIVHWAFIKVV